MKQIKPLLQKELYDVDYMQKLIKGEEENMTK
jgi:hypothetical protein